MACQNRAVCRLLGARMQPSIAFDSASDAEQLPALVAGAYGGVRGGSPEWGSLSLSWRAQPAGLALAGALVQDACMHRTLRQGPHPSQYDTLCRHVRSTPLRAGGILCFGRPQVHHVESLWLAAQMCLRPHAATAHQQLKSHDTCSQYSRIVGIPVVVLAVQTLVLPLPCIAPPAT